MKLFSPRILLHFEGAAVLAVALVAYHLLNASWVLFGLLFLAPDLSMFGYLAGPQIGARVYNLFHTYTVPLIVLAVGHLGHHPQMIAVAIIWVGHIGIDRLLGYGLKYPDAFKETHLGRV